MNSQYKRLIENLDEFIQRYYLDKIIRGVLFTLGILLSFFLIFILTEYFLFLDSSFRKAILYVYLLISTFSLVFFVGVPFLRLVNLLKRITHEKAAVIIGNQFPEIDDKILNTIQLYKDSNLNNFDNLLLINASIEQRVLNFGVFRFKNVINLKLNRKYLKFALPPALILLVLLIGSPTLILEPTQRLVHYDSLFVPKAPFEFVLLNSNLNVEEGQDLQLKMQLKGESIPSEVVLVIDGFEYLMKKNSISEFTFNVEKIKSPLRFFFASDKYFSKPYQINLVHTPKIVDVDIEINYPAYLGKSSEKLSKLTEILIPEGSTLIFDVRTRDADSLSLFSDTYGKRFLKFSNANRLKFDLKRINQNTRIQLLPINDEVENKDTVDYSISIIKDAYPTIKVTEFTDSIFEKRKFFKGLIRDDYGFSALKMEINYTNMMGQDTQIFIPIVFGHLPTTQEFFNYLDIKSLNPKLGSIVSYSFLVYDNDGINGAKISRSQLFTYQLKTEEQEQKEAEERAENLNTEVGSSSKEAEKLAKKIENLTEKMRGKKSLSWEEKKEIEDLIKQFEKLQNNIKNHVKESEENLLKNKEELNQAEELNQKQEEIKKLMEELFTPEMKEMMKELQKMMEKNAPKEKIEESLEKMKLDAEFMKEQLDRELEMMKQLKFDQKLQQSIDKLRELQQQQEDLSKDLKSNSEEIRKKQEELNNEFNQFEELMKEAKNANSELKEPNNMKDTKSEEESIKSEMKQSSEKLSEGKKNSAQKNQQNASQKMEELADELEKMQSEMEQESQSEDIDNLKNILHNLIEISFNQEKLMEKVKYTSNRDPQFPKFIEEQKKIANDLEMVEDSLNKIADRNPSISPVISKELKSIKAHSELAFNDLKEMNTIGPTSSYQMTKSTANQQFIMTSVNNLALMLSEALNQMQQQQQKQKGGKGSCKNPKPGAGSSGKMKTMREMQQELQKQMEKMKQQMDAKGQKPGGKGQNSGGGEQMSEEMARLAAQQEALRKMVQEYRDQLAKEGKMKEAGSLGEAAKQMEQTETELVNRMLTSESLIRQKEIITRLLESERSEREREQSEERESKEGKNQNNSNKNLILKYKEVYQEDVELLKTIPPNLKPFYKKMVDIYFSN